MKINSKFTRIVGVGVSVAMLATTVLTAVPAFADVSAVTVVPNATGISQNASWDIRFTATNAIADALNGNITITFPSGFSVNNSGLLTDNTTGFSIAAGPGWLDQATFGNAVLSAMTANGTTATRKVIIKLGATAVIGAGAQVRIILPVGTVTNPTTAGSYNVTIATTNDTTAIASANFVITLPNIGPLPGLIQAKNSNGDLLYQSLDGNINTAMNTAGVARVELAAGTYNGTYTAATINQTIIGVGAAGSAIITAPAGLVPLTITNYGVVINNVTINGNRDFTANDTSIGANATFVNVTFNNGVSQAFVAGAANAIFQNCIFNATGNVSNGISSNGTITVTNSTFNLDTGANGIWIGAGANVTNSTFTGSTSAGEGIHHDSGTSIINNNTFTSIGNAALDVDGGVVSAAGNTFTGCGSSTASTSTGVVDIQGGQLGLINNTITNSNAANYALNVNGAAANLTAIFNTITGNTLNARQIAGTANLSLNWWGSKNGPAATTLSSVTSSLLVTTPFLGAVASNGVADYVPGSNLTAGSINGVDISTANGTFNFATVTNFGTVNPQLQGIAPTGTPIAYYDVRIGTTPGAEPSSITIKFYGNVNASTKVYYGGGLSGAWVPADTQGVNVAAGFAFITISTTSTPGYSDLGGTIFALSNTISPPAAPTLVGPTGTSVPLNTGFSWSAVTGADTYNFQVSTSPTFAGAAAPTTGLTATVFGGVALTGNTTYYWRVQAVNAGGISAWATGTFTTNAATTGLPPITTVNITTAPPVVNIAPAAITVQPPNVTVNPPQVTITAPPPANVTVNPPQVTVQAPPAANVQVNVPEQPALIPTYILWTIILIGAVLVIALIVLIVRTRRVA